MDTSSKLDLYFKNNVSSKLNTKLISKLRYYSEYDAHSLNQYLLSVGQSNNLYDSTIGLIRNGIKLSKTPFPITVYHGTSSRVINGRTMDDYHSPTLLVKTLLSCSIDKDIASIFMPVSSSFCNCMMLEINLPSGYPAL